MGTHNNFPELPSARHAQAAMQHHLGQIGVGQDIWNPPPATSEQVAAVETEVRQVATIFNGFGRPWFLAGGTALELSQNKITRDHKGSDIELDSKYLPEFYEFAHDMGYRFFGPAGQTITSPEGLVAQGHNAFLDKVKLTSDTELEGFEIMFLQRNKDGGVVFGYDRRLTFPAIIYENSPTHNTRDGQAVPLTPNEVQLFYKLSDGRRKDLHDIRAFLPKLAPEQRERLERYLAITKRSFVVGSVVTTDLDELLRHAGAVGDEQKRELVAGEIANIRTDDGMLRATFTVAQETTSAADFLTTLKRTFMGNLFAFRARELHKTARFLFAAPRSFEEFFAYELQRRLQVAANKMVTWRVTKEP